MALAHPAGAIACLVEKSGKGGRAFEQREMMMTVGVAVGPVGVVIQTGEDHAAAGGAGGGGAEAVLEPHALLGEPVHIRRADDLVAVAAQSLPPVIVGNRQDDVRTLCV